ncbi:hypothetical protein AX16_006807 [Volvariella volvacea WC 439]|nr:hypothetical protein AX16_006807 [Volvariella volvacea WC 439]
MLVRCNASRHLILIGVWKFVTAIASSAAAIDAARQVKPITSNENPPMPEGTPTPEDGTSDSESPLKRFMKEPYRGAPLCGIIY